MSEADTGADFDFPYWEDDDPIWKVDDDYDGTMTYATFDSNVDNFVHDFPLPATLPATVEGKWVPFPISIKEKTGKHHFIPKPRIGSVHLGRGHLLFGHVFYAEDIADLKARKNQPLAASDNIFIVPPLSSHAVCVPCAERNRITTTSPTPAPPQSYKLLPNKQIVMSFMDDVRETHLPDGTSAPYTRVFFVSLNPSATTDEKPPEIAQAHAKMRRLASAYGGILQDIHAELDGLDDLYNPPPDMPSRWVATLVLNYKITEKDSVVDVFNLILYLARGFSKCTGPPVFIAYLQMKSKHYEFLKIKDRPKPKEVPVAFAIPPLFDYEGNSFCQSDYVQTNCSYYQWDNNKQAEKLSASASDWQRQVLRNYTALPDQEIQWLAPNLYNYIYDGGDGLDRSQFLRRDDSTKYKVRRLEEAYTDLYWALMPDVKNVLPYFEEEEDSLLAKTMARAKVEARHRLDWFARYGRVFKSDVSYSADFTQSAARDVRVYWKDPGSREQHYLGEIDGKPVIIKKGPKFAPVGPIKKGSAMTEEDKEAMKMAAHTRDRERWYVEWDSVRQKYPVDMEFHDLSEQLQTRHETYVDGSSENGIGLFFYNLYGKAVEFPTPLRGRYTLETIDIETSSLQVFTRHPNGQYIFCLKNDPYVHGTEKIWYGYTRLYNSEDRDFASPILKIVRSTEEDAVRDSKYFYLLKNFNADGTADPAGTYRRRHEDDMLVLAPLPLLDKTYVLNGKGEFVPAEHGLYRFVRVAEDFQVVLQVGSLLKYYLMIRPDRTPITVPFREINRRFVIVNPKLYWDICQIETRGYFVLESDLTPINEVLRGTCDF